MNTRLRPLIAAVLTVALMLTCPVSIAGGHGRDRGSNDASDGGGVSADQAAAIVKRAYDGRVVSVKQEGDGYKVRVLLDGGRVKTVQVDSHGNLSDSN